MHSAYDEQGRQLCPTVILSSKAFSISKASKLHMYNLQLSSSLLLFVPHSVILYIWDCQALRFCLFLIEILIAPHLSMLKSSQISDGFVFFFSFWSGILTRQLVPLSLQVILLSLIILPSFPSPDNLPSPAAQLDASLPWPDLLKSTPTQSNLALFELFCCSKPTTAIFPLER